jgi:hypothetical protein
MDPSKTINKMDKEWYNGLMGININEIEIKVNFLVKDLIFSIKEKWFMVIYKILKMMKIINFQDSM